MKAEQKFHKGDRVHIAKITYPCMSHFTSEVDATVVGSYRDQFEYGSDNLYTLDIDGEGEVSWYYEYQLTFIKRAKE